jgi:undecaprenyl phosphate-alpha-L-ara4FN deformylase
VVQATVALRVDVDTRRGLDEGVPRLLELFRELGIRASFFVTMGPDRSGAAIRRAWRPSFLMKMWRTRAWRLYGLRTVLSGSLLPARPVGCGAPALLRQLVAEGHELAPHGFDHVGWQDRVHGLAPAALRADLAAAADSFHSIVGARPHASAAPGWRTTGEGLLAQEEFGYRYASDTRGSHPFRPVVSGRGLTTIQIPTTMPTMDELIGRVPSVDAALAEAVRPGLNVLTLHAEVEGREFFHALCSFFRLVRARKPELVRLADVERALDPDRLPVLGITRTTVPGRSGWIAAHEPRRGHD